MSTRDKKLLIILAGVAILALTYFLIFIPQSNKRDSLKSENMNLKSQYNQLSALAAKADDYTKKTKDMSDAMQQVYDNFPSYLQIARIHSSSRGLDSCFSRLKATIMEVHMHLTSCVSVSITRCAR